jgi:hypothetical protein
VQVSHSPISGTSRPAEMLSTETAWTMETMTSFLHRELTENNFYGSFDILVDFIRERILLSVVFAFVVYSVTSRIAKWRSIVSIFVNEDNSSAISRESTFPTRLCFLVGPMCPDSSHMERTSLLKVTEWYQYSEEAKSSFPRVFSDSSFQIYLTPSWIAAV